MCSQEGDLGGFCLTSEPIPWWFIAFRQSPETYHLLPACVTEQLLCTIDQMQTRHTTPKEATASADTAVINVTVLSNQLRAPMLGPLCTFNPDVLGYTHMSSTVRKRDTPCHIGPPTCVICLDRVACNAFIPCGHLSVCDSCALVLYNQEREVFMRERDSRMYDLKCSLCRRVSTGIYRIYGAECEGGGKKARA